MQFYPADAPVPTEYATQDLVLRVLRPEHVEIDYAAFMSSRERLLVWSGGGWPAADFTLEQNMDDMHRHEDAYIGRTQFTFTVLNPDATMSEGCVYIDSWDAVLQNTTATPESLGVGDYKGVATYWVRDSALERDLDRQLLAGLRAWFKSDDWSFKRVVFRANQDQVRDIQVFEDAGLRPLYTVESSTDGSRVSFYGEE